MNKQSLACLCLCLSSPAILLVALAFPMNTAVSQITKEETHRVYIPMVSVSPVRLEQQFLGNLGGTASFFAVSGNLAFLNIPGKLQLLDVSDPNQPTFLSEITLPGNPVQLQVQDGYAYLAMGYLGMAILDIHVPEMPAIAAILPLTGTTTHVLLSGNLAYLSNSQGLFMVDISQPRDPVVLSNIEIYANWSMFLQDNLLVVGDGLTIFNLSNPTSPAYISKWDDHNGNAGFTLLGVYNNRAYYSEASCGMECIYWMDVVVLSDPYHPHATNIHMDHGASAIQFNNDIIYIADGSQIKTFELLNDGTYLVRSILDVPGRVGWMYSENDRLYISSSDSIEVININYPDDPDILGMFTPEIPCSLFQPALPMIYCSYNINTVDKKASGFQVFNVSDPRKIIWIGAYETDVYPFLVNQVYLDGDRLYLASRPDVGGSYPRTEELLIYNLADPLVPQFISRYPIQLSYGLPDIDFYHSAQITDQIGYFITVGGDLEITDLSDPINPKIISTYEANSWLVRADLPYVYLLSHDMVPEGSFNTLTTLDATSLSTPTLQSRYLIISTGTYGWWEIQGFDVFNGIAYIGLPGELQVVDVRDAQRPALLSILNWEPPWSTPSAIEAEEGVVLIGRDGILEVVDVADPSAPVVVGSITTGGHPSMIQIIGNLAYVACRETGTQVIDLKDPANPKLVKQYYGNTASFQTSQGYPVYLANRWDGLQIYKPYPVNTRR